MARYPQQLVDQAKLRYLQGRSFREIADELLPTSSGGWVTIFRWKKQYGWEEEKQELERRKQEALKDDLASGMAQMAKAHLDIASKALMAVEMALDEAFERDPLTGRIIAVKKNPKTGMPVLWGQPMVMLLDRATDIQRRALGVGDGIPRADLERAATVAVQEDQQADPHLLKQFGDFLALQAPEPVPEPGTATEPLPESGTVDAPDTPPDGA